MTQRAPEVLAGGRVDREVEGLVARRLALTAHGDVTLEHLHHEAAVMKQRARGEGPLKRKGPEVAAPEFFAAEIECNEVAGAKEEHHGFPVSGGRGGAGVAVLSVR